MKATAIAHPDIAFIKYWGKADPKLRIPQNNSLSMILSEPYSLCTVEFSNRYKKDEIVFLNEKEVKKEELKRISRVLDRVRKLAGSTLKAKVMTKNSFPKGVGLASSGSGLSSVTLASVKALGIQMNQKDLSRLARLASGTATRCVCDGFVEWIKGEDDKTSYARQIFTPNYWEIRDVIAIVSADMKKIKSTKGHSLAKTSPFYEIRLREVEKRLKDIKMAIKERNFSKFGHIIEEECFSMHAICLTSRPSILYWNALTVEIMRKIRLWRANKEMEAFFTIDAGPTVHIICEGKNSRKLVNKLKGIKGIQRLSVNKPALGVRAIKKHLF